MKKKLLTILLTLFLFSGISLAQDTIPVTLPGDDQVALLAVITPSYTVAPSGDTCTGTLLFSAHFENDDDVTVGTPAGCTVSPTKTITKTGAAFTDTIKSDGTYCLEANAENHYVVISATNMDVMTTGTWACDVYVDSAHDGNMFMLTVAGPYGEFVSATGQKIRFNYGAQGYKTSANAISATTWTRVLLSWDLSGGAGACKLAVKVGANAWEEQAGMSLTPVANPATYGIIGWAWGGVGGYFDKLKLYSDYQHAE